MAFETLNSMQQCIPDDVAGVSVAPSGVSGTFGAWVQLSASMSSAACLTGITIKCTTNEISTAVTSWDMRVGKGAAGVETVVCYFPSRRRFTAGPVYQTTPRLDVVPASIPVTGISSSDRVAIGFRTYNSSVIAVAGAALWVPNPISGTLETTASPLLPSADVAITSSATPWASSSYSQLFASTSAAIVVNSIDCDDGTSAGDCEVDVATGAAASETVVLTVRAHPGQDKIIQTTFLGVLFDNIAATTRVALRARHELASQSLTLRVGYYEKPL
jgi:hypothetical protein